MPNVTLYLPDELAERFKGTDANLNMSGLLQRALRDELDRRERHAGGGMELQELEVEGNEPVTLRFTGRPLAGDGDLDVYLTDDGRVVMVEPESYSVFDDERDFGDFVSQEGGYELRNQLRRSSEVVLGEAAAELGLPRVVEL